MKRYVRASLADNLLDKGSGQNADKRSGRITLGKQYNIPLPNGGYLDVTSPKLMFDVNTGRVDSSMNVYVGLNAPYTFLDGTTVSKLEYSVGAYTIDELERAYQFLSSLSKDELYQVLVDKEEARSARWKAEREARMGI